MTGDKEILVRSDNKCELCKSTSALSFYNVAPESASGHDSRVYLCAKCQAQLEKKEPLDSGHWKFLPDVMWTEVPAIQVIAWRMLNRLRQESWAAENLDMMYLDEDTLAWAKSSGDHDNDSAPEFHKDANGNILSEGDSIVLTKSLDVKGSNLNAKMGTIVKNIRLVKDNTEQIEGKIEGQTIVILTKYVRKQGS